jgi:hypothetical protein
MYEIKGVPLGDMAITIKAPNYEFTDKCDSMLGAACISINKNRSKNRIDYELKAKGPTAGKKRFENKLVVEGKIIDEKGKSITGVEIKNVFGFRIHAGGGAKTDSSGNFRFEPFRPDELYFLGSLYIIVNHPAYSHEIFKLSRPDKNGMIGNVNLTLRRGQRISGTFRNKAGAVMGNQPIEIYKNINLFYPLANTVTDPKGHYEFKGISEGTYYICLPGPQNIVNIRVKEGEDIENLNLVYDESKMGKLVSDNMLQKLLEQTYDVDLKWDGGV